MNEFANLLIRASRTMGTLYALAMLLNAEPREVYHWIAGIERPRFSVARDDSFQSSW